MQKWVLGDEVLQVGALGHGEANSVQLLPRMWQVPREKARALGYPSHELLGNWIVEFAPCQQKHRGPNPMKGALPMDARVQTGAVRLPDCLGIRKKEE